jgi:hypothetical protein
MQVKRRLKIYLIHLPGQNLSKHGREVIIKGSKLSELGFMGL